MSEKKIDQFQKMNETLKNCFEIGEEQQFKEEPGKGACFYFTLP